MQKMAQTGDDSIFVFDVVTISGKKMWELGEEVILSTHGATDLLRQ